jgi:AcrR family transcriptional regulator
MPDYSTRDYKKRIRARRDREKDRRMREILLAAKKAFLEKGYRKTTMDDIAFEAELSKPAIYEHFKTKEDLLFSLGLPILEDIGRELQAIKDKLAAKNYTNGSDVVEDLFESFFRMYKSDPTAFAMIAIYNQDILAGQLDKRTELGLSKQGSFNLGCLRDIGELAMEQGLIKRIPVYEFADILWGIVSGVIYIVNTKRKEREEPRYLKTTYDLAKQIFLEAALTQS